MLQTNIILMMMYKRMPKWWQSSTWLRFPALSIRSRHHFNINTATVTNIWYNSIQPFLYFLVSISPFLLLICHSSSHSDGFLSFRELSDSLATVSTSLGRKGECREEIFQVENFILTTNPFYKRKMAFEYVQKRYIPSEDSKGQWRLIIVALLLKPGFMQ